MFSIKCITEAGRSLLNSALLPGSGTLYWTDLKTSNSTTTSLTEEDMMSLTDIKINVSDNYTSSGSVTNVVQSGDGYTLSIHGELNNNAYHGTAKLFGLWAKLGESGTPVLTIVAKNNYQIESDFTFDDISDAGSQIAFIDYSLTLDTGGSITSSQVTADYYATQSALASEIGYRVALDNQAVKLTGNQSISGDKTFTGVTYFSDNIRLSTNNTVSIGTGSNKLQSVYTVSCFADNASIESITSDLLPSTTNTYNVGSSSNKWQYVYATTFVGNLSGNASTASSATTAEKANNATSLAYYSGLIATAVLSANQNNIEFSSDIVPNTSGTLDIGKSNKMLNCVYTYNIGTSSNKVTHIYATNIHGNLDGNASTATTATHSTNLSVGTTRKMYVGSDSITSVVKIVPTGSGTVDLGTGSNKWGNLYVSTIPGITSENITTRHFNTWQASGTGSISQNTSDYNMTTTIKIGNVDSSEVVRKFIANTLSAASQSTSGADTAGVGAIRLAALLRTNTSSTSYSDAYRNLIVAGSNLLQVSLYGSTGTLNCRVYTLPYTYGTGTWLFLSPLMNSSFTGYIIGLAVRIA